MFKFDSNEGELCHIAIDQEYSGQNTKMEELKEVIKKLEVQINMLQLTIVTRNNIVAAIAYVIARLFR